jgi:hypothetical protein
MPSTSHEPITIRELVIPNQLKMGFQMQWEYLIFLPYVHSFDPFKFDHPLTPFHLCSSKVTILLRSFTFELRFDDFGCVHVSTWVLSQNPLTKVHCFFT